MSDSQQNRKGGAAPGDTEELRRLRVVSSYTDPFLVTKLPQEANVVSGVVRLGEKTVLGFLHRPFADGTRVRIIYRDWLFAERLSEPASEVPPQEETASGEAESAGEEADTAGADYGEVDTAGEEAGESEDASGAEEGPSLETASEQLTASEPPAKAITPSTGAKVVGDESVPTVPAASRPEANNGPEAKNRPEATKASPPGSAANRAAIDRQSEADDDTFPDDLTGTDARDRSGRIGDDRWTATFSRRDRSGGSDDTEQTE